MPSKPFQEKRTSPRVANNVPLKISAPNADFVTETKNISSAGVYCKVDKYIEPMTKLMICLLLPMKRNEHISTKKITCSGVVVRTENILNDNGFNIAIFFNDIHPKDSRTLAEFVGGALDRTKDQAGV